MNDINNLDIRTHIIDAIVNVFDTMVSLEVAFFDFEPPDATGTERMAATVNFAGNVIGYITIQVPSEMSDLMLAALPDSGAEEIEGEGKIREVIAEISQAVGSSLKSALNDDGHQCVISTPSITYGTDFTIKSLQMERHERFIFAYQENYIFVEVGLKPEQATSAGDDPGQTEIYIQPNNAEAVKIDSLDLNTRVSEAVIDVFDTMLSLKLEPADAVSEESLEGMRTVSSVSIAGDANGIIRIHAGDSLSREMAAKMLGREVGETESDEEIRDMFGEMGNIVGGNLKSVFTDAGIMCALSTPSFTTGSDFKIEAHNMENFEQLAFRCGKNDVVIVELGVKPSELVQTDTRQGEEIPTYDDETTQADMPADSQQVAAQDAATTASHPAETQASKTPEDLDLDLLLDIPLKLKVELGRARIKIHKLLKLAPGSAVKLIKLERDPVDILVNDTLIARGEVVVQNEKYGIRVTEITNRMDRIRSFGI